MRIWTLALMFLVGCRSDASMITPLACGSPCGTSQECRLFLSSCNVCFNGKCTTSLPAQPVVDAGVDAPATTQ